MKQNMFDEYNDTNNPLQSTIVAAFWSIMAIIIAIQFVRFIVWLIKMI